MPYLIRCSNGLQGEGQEKAVVSEQFQESDCCMSCVVLSKLTNLSVPQFLQL